MVNAQELRGHWGEVQGKLRKRWSQLTDNEVGEFSGNVQELVSKIERKTGAARESVETFLSEILESADEKMSGVRDYARESLDAVNQAVADGVAEAEDFVQRRPGQAVGLAIGVGVVLGLFLSLLFRDRTREQQNQASADRYLQQLAEAIQRWLPDALTRRG